MIIFSGTSYLGLDQHPKMIENIHKGLQLYGTHYGGSRRSSLAPKIYQLAEENLAQWTGAPAALLVSSGTTAGRLITKYLEQKHWNQSYSPNVHPAQWSFNTDHHKDWTSWFNSLEKHKTVGLTDAINPLLINTPNWQLLPQQSSACLVVDDAHCIGISGQNGAGNWRMLRSLWQGELIVTASLGKALTIPAGVILASKQVINEIQSLPQFGGASPPPPAYIYALHHATELITEQQTKLQKNIRLLHDSLAGQDNFNTLSNYPVTGVTDHSLVPKLEKAGIHISSFRYPSNDDPIYTRIVLRADHPEEEIHKLLSIISS